MCEREREYVWVKVLFMGSRVCVCVYVCVSRCYFWEVGRESECVCVRERESERERERERERVCVGQGVVYGK